MSVFDDVPDYATGKTLADKLKEGSFPKINLTFTFEDDDSVYYIPVIFITKNVKAVGFNCIPTFETADGHSKLIAETFSVEIGYGEGIDL